MKKKLGKALLLVIVIPLILYAIRTFAIYRKSLSATGILPAATWSVTRSQSDDSIDIMPELTTDIYNLTVQSNSEVDVEYKIIISNLPTGVEVDLDNSGNYRTPTDGNLTIQTANTVINYNDTTKTKHHVLTFRATSEASLVTNREINIDVEFKQIV